MGNCEPGIKRELHATANRTAASTAARQRSAAQREISLEPLVGNRRHLLDFPGFPKKVGCADDDFQQRLAIHFFASPAVVLEVGVIISSHNHERGGLHVPQQILSKVRTATTGNHGMHVRRSERGSNHGGRRSSAPAEQPDAQSASGWIGREAINDGDEPHGRPLDFLPLTCRLGRAVIFKIRSIAKIRQQHGESALKENAGD